MSHRISRVLNFSNTTHAQFILRKNVLMSKESDREKKKKKKSHCVLHIFLTGLIFRALSWVLKMKKKKKKLP